MKNIMILLLGMLITISLNSQSLEKLIESNNKFTFDVFKEISKSTDSGNVFLSPLSVSTALSMAYYGAAGNTAKEIKDVLYFTGSPKNTHNDFKNLLNYYKLQYAHSFNISNAAVIQDKYNFKKPYLELLDGYDAKMIKTNFRDEKEREDARKNINKWIAENTGNKIEELLGKESLDDRTRLVLLNAIYFKNNWKYSFSEKKTQQMIFYGLSDIQYVTDFMNVREKFNYYEDENIRMIELPYENDSISMYVIQPGGIKDFNEFCTSFSYDDFSIVEKQATKVRNIDLYFPKFTISGKYDLKEPLMQVGINDAFSANANFSKMTGRKDLFIDEVMHQSFIEVDEKGTEASAATAVVIKEKSVPQVIHVSFNKPFIFIIKEKSKNSVLFVGKYVKP
ncbi:MAG: serpin family protein [Bacteroidales bacterium]|jgi:serpin B|nr:serpin family protein [Bacteroidales bacterium]